MTQKPSASPPEKPYEDPIQEADWLNEPSTLEEEGWGFTQGLHPRASPFSDDDDWSNPWAGLDN